jgi:predicted extracellular nuclease
MNRSRGTATVLVARPATAAPTDLFISEYVEGSGSNKALELYNGTGAPIVLDGAYDVQLFANGSPTPTATIALTGTIASGDTFVLVRSASDPALLALGDQSTTNFLCSSVSKGQSADEPMTATLGTAVARGADAD